MNALLNQQEISEWCGHKHRAKIERWLLERNIPFFYGKDNLICTTTESIQQALNRGDVKRFAPKKAG